jgi:hypothetical protein
VQSHVTELLQNGHDLVLPSPTRPHTHTRTSHPQTSADSINPAWVEPQRTPSGSREARLAASPSSTAGRCTHHGLLQHLLVVGAQQLLQLVVQRGQAQEAVAPRPAGQRLERAVAQRVEDQPDVLEAPVAARLRGALGSLQPRGQLLVRDGARAANAPSRVSPLSGLAQLSPEAAPECFVWRSVVYVRCGAGPRDERTCPCRDTDGSGAADPG